METIMFPPCTGIRYTVGFRAGALRPRQGHGHGITDICISSEKVSGVLSESESLCLFQFSFPPGRVFKLSQCVFFQMNLLGHGYGIIDNCIPSGKAYGLISESESLWLFQFSFPPGRVFKLS